MLLVPHNSEDREFKWGRVIPANVKNIGTRDIYVCDIEDHIAQYVDREIRIM